MSDDSDSGVTGLADLVEGAMGRQKFYGKYRGTVINNVDPMQIGRIQVMVPDVSNFVPTSWAMPSLPVGGFRWGCSRSRMIGTGVWVEFEQGDPDYPIWTGVSGERRPRCLCFRTWYRPPWPGSHCRRRCRTES